MKGTCFTRIHNPNLTCLWTFTEYRSSVSIIKWDKTLQGFITSWSWPLMPSCRLRKHFGFNEQVTRPEIQRSDRNWRGRRTQTTSDWLEKVEVFSFLTRFGLNDKMVVDKERTSSFRVVLSKLFLVQLCFTTHGTYSCLPKGSCIAGGSSRILRKLTVIQWILWWMIGPRGLVSVDLG